MRTHSGQTGEERVAQLEAELLNLVTCVAQGTVNHIFVKRAYRCATNATLKEATVWFDKQTAPAPVDKVVSAEVQRDYEDWKNGNTLAYAGFAVKRTTDFGIGDNPAPGAHGWVVVRNGCNPMPGATWARSMEGARQLIDVWLATGPADHDIMTAEGRDASNEHGQRFWHLLRAIQAGKAS